MNHCLFELQEEEIQEEERHWRNTIRGCIGVIVFCVLFVLSAFAVEIWKDAQRTEPSGQLAKSPSTVR